MVSLADVRPGSGAQEEALVLAIDQGTTGTTAVLYQLAPDESTGSLKFRALTRKTRDFPQHFPAPGWVEHDAEEIWQSVVGAVGDVLALTPGAARRIAAIGLTNQRETVLLWERKTGKAVAPALVWQDRRTSERCHELRASAQAALIQDKTGLVIDPYFSATKLEWLFKNNPGLQERAERGELCFGTIDSYLTARLGGAAAPHIIEFTNASRTLLFDLRAGKFDDDLLELFSVPKACVPRVIASNEIATRTSGFPGLPDGIPIAGIAGDQHAALFGQGALDPGQGKCTIGTGAFLLVTTGDQAVKSLSGLLTTPAWKLGERVQYALEGSAFTAGAAVGFLRDSLGMISSAKEVEALSRTVPDSGGVVFVPALAGLAAPHWLPDARGLLAGLTRGTTRGHIARAVLDGIAHEVTDLIETVAGDLRGAGLPALAELRVDGGASENDLLLELLSDFARLAVKRGRDVESTARGAGLLAALGAGLVASEEIARDAFELDRAFEPPENAAFSEAARRAYHETVRVCAEDAAMRRTR